MNVTLRCAGGELGHPWEHVLVRTDLSDPGATVEVDWCEGLDRGWELTKHQAGEIGGSSDPVAAFEQLARQIVAAGIGEDAFTGPVMVALDGEESLHAIVANLWAHGSAFSGGTDTRVWEVAKEWAALGLDLAAVRLWTSVGCWDAATADTLASAGITPARAREIANQVNPRHRWTTDDPLYQLCNGDISVTTFVGLVDPTV
jgi:hypothetical protein